uniref:alpha-N-acetylgalactosaminide alpha-2,6-sialyltransferase n=1 Tax=Periophthalmus magnuspinnatus TaxID=409849 RepID=A0A3B4A2X8_9GOBI
MCKCALITQRKLWKMEPLLLPKPGRDCITCAVVANGGVLWRSKKGAEIDSHDYVFRVNGAVTKGFEEDVGNRTDVYVHTAHSITQSEIVLWRYHYERAPHDQVWRVQSWFSLGLYLKSLYTTVDAYGFITENYKLYSNYYVERGAKTRVVFYENHDYPLEMALWRRLHDLGIIHLYLGEPRETERTAQPTTSANATHTKGKKS